MTERLRKVIYGKVYNLARSAWATCRMRAPIVLARYAALTYLNRTSRQRRIRRLPDLKPICSPSAVDRRTVVKAKWKRPLGDVVIPVYNNFEDTRNLLESLRQQGPLLGKIIIVNDCSTDQRIASYIQAFADRHANTVALDSRTNLGFVHACNRGLAASHRDCVILNTDIELPPGALSRLLSVLQSSDEIATVTPFSNSAYAVGVPHLNYRNARPFGADTAEIDACFQSLGPLAPIELPRGVGFCMGISRQALSRLGPFRECFGAGYGEEADFCLRAWKAGLSSILATNVYVFHKEGGSFGDSATQRAREGALRLLALHSNYVRSVARYLHCGQSRAVSFAAMVLLAQRLSGQELSRRELITPRISHQRRGLVAPQLLLEKKANGIVATLAFANEKYRYPFSNVQLFEAALTLVPSTSSTPPFASRTAG